jgi:crotonobetainyl-CoA:carnitine CoA-transferase CaiB-like acyl-CoA transferase
MLSGVRVLDLSSGIAGSYCTKLWADAGADVVKVEPPEGDPLRRWSASGSRPQGQDGALFAFLNTSKRSVVAELSSPEVAELAAGADVIVESLAPGELGNLGLGSANPSLVVVSITPFGQDGPWAGRPATEFTLQALCGSTASRGRPDGPPLAAGGRIGEWVGGSYAAVAGLAALWGAQRTGRGEHVDVSLLECMCVTMNTFAPVFASFVGWRKAPGPPRSIEIPSIEPTKDGYVGFCTITAQQFQDFLVLIERPDLLEDASLASVQNRVARMDEVLAIIHAWTTRHTTEEAIELASALRIPVAPIGNGRTVLGMDHFRERGTFVANPSGFRQPRVPYRISGRQPAPFRPAPSLGEHTGRASWGPRQALPALTGRRDPSWPDSESQDPSLPLAGLRIVDFTAFWAGPAGSHVLAALGADVIKVESPRRPDGMRFTTTARPPADRWWEWCPVFHGANANKRSVTLDLNHAEGLEAAKSLIRRADAVMENFTPRVMEGFGLGWEEVHALAPQVVMVRMPGFGLSGPWRDRTGFAQTMEQVSGMAWVTGFADGPPVLPRGACDPMAGMHAAFALLLAVAEARRSGQGQLVEVTMVECALNAAAEQVVEYSAYGALLGRQGNRGPGAAPQGLYRCRGEESWLALAVETEAQWGGLRAALGDPEWARRPELETAEGRRAAHDDIDGHLASWCRQRPAEEAAARLWDQGVPAAQVVDPTEIGRLPQLAARGLFEALDHPVVGRHPVPAVPFRFRSRKRRWLRTPPPTLGQHNQEVLGSLLGAEALEGLRREQVAAETLLAPS